MTDPVSPARSVAGTLARTPDSERQQDAEPQPGSSLGGPFPGLPRAVPDWVLLAVLLALEAFRGAGQVNASHPPVEDAAMLLRYAANFAATGTISWNPHGPPVEGATDFLFMAAVAGLAALTHANVLLLARLLLFACSLALVALVYAAPRLSLGTSRSIAFALGLYLSFTGLETFVRSGFAAPFLMLLVALATWVAMTLMRDGEPVPWSRAFAFSLLALLAGLTRPEANFLVLLLLAGIVMVRGRAASRRVLVSFACVFAVLGGAYFAWRWHYFGYLLPNPFYVKGGGHLHLHGLSTSLNNAALMLLPLVPAYLAGLANDRSRRLLAAVLMPVAGFTVLFVLLSPENNFLMRFQAPLLPLALVLLPLVLHTAGLNSLTPRGVWQPASVYALAAYVVLACVYAAQLYDRRDVQTSAMAFAAHLSQYKDRGYTMATTEAGEFPLFSQWNAIDALGLNDVEVAHHGLSEAYLERAAPQLILYHYAVPHAPAGLTAAEDRAAAGRFLGALRVLHGFAVRHGYILAAAYGGDPCSLHVFYVRPGTPDTDAMVRYLRDTPYYFLDTGVLSVDYREGFRPECRLPNLDAGAGADARADAPGSAAGTAH